MATYIRNHTIGSKRSLLLTYTKTLEQYLAASAMIENTLQAMQLIECIGGLITIQAIEKIKNMMKSLLMKLKTSTK